MGKKRKKTGGARWVVGAKGTVGFGLPELSLNPGSKSLKAQEGQLGKALLGAGGVGGGVQEVGGLKFSSRWVDHAQGGVWGKKEIQTKGKYTMPKAGKVWVPQLGDAKVLIFLETQRGKLDMGVWPLSLMLLGHLGGGWPKQIREAYEAEAEVRAKAKKAKAEAEMEARGKAEAEAEAARKAEEAEALLFNLLGEVEKEESLGALKVLLGVLTGWLATLGECGALKRVVNHNAQVVVVIKTLLLGEVSGDLGGLKASLNYLKEEHTLFLKELGRLKRGNVSFSGVDEVIGAMHLDPLHRWEVDGKVIGGLPDWKEEKVGTLRAKFSQVGEWDLEGKEKEALGVILEELENFEETEVE